MESNSPTTPTAPPETPPEAPPQETPQADAQEEPRADGRDSKGRFTPGNPGGPGNPFARRVAELRRELLDFLEPQRLRELVAKLYGMAMDGDLAAAKLVLAYALGKPGNWSDPDRLDLHEWDIQKGTAQMMRELPGVMLVPEARFTLDLTRATRGAMNQEMARRSSEQLRQQSRRDQKRQEKRERERLRRQQRKAAAAQADAAGAQPTANGGSGSAKPQAAPTANGGSGSGGRVPGFAAPTANGPGGVGRRFPEPSANGRGGRNEPPGPSANGKDGPGHRS